MEEGPSVRVHGEAWEERGWRHKLSQMGVRDSRKGCFATGWWRIYHIHGVHRGIPLEGQLLKHFFHGVFFVSHNAPAVSHFLAAPASKVQVHTASLPPQRLSL